VARELAARLRLSPTSEEILAIVPPDLAPLFAEVEHVLTDPGDGFPPSSLLAQIVAVVDAYFAATRPRDNRQRVSPRRAILDLRAAAGTRVRPEVVEALVDHLREIVSALDLGESKNGPRLLVASVQRGGELASALARDGYAVDRVENGNQAWEKLRKEVYRGAIVERELAGRDGVALLRLCRANPDTEQMPILILATGGDQDLESEVERAGAAEVLQSGAALEAIRARVAQVLGRPLSR
jgi:response regulator RpfG family c-di-GMP phosphodiesterase